MSCSARYRQVSIDPTIFPLQLTTSALNGCNSGCFGACSCKPTSRDKTPILCVASWRTIRRTLCYRYAALTSGTILWFELDIFSSNDNARDEAHRSLSVTTSRIKKPTIRQASTQTVSNLSAMYLPSFFSVLSSWQASLQLPPEPLLS